MSFREEPYFITGCPKSGTSLVTTMLNNHPDFLLEFEFHVAFHLVQYYYEQPNHPLVRRDYKTGDPLSQTRNVELFEQGEFTNIIREAFGKLHRGWHLGKHWGSELRALIGYPKTLLRLYPNAKFVNVLRDPRDTFTSMSNTNWEEQAWSKTPEGFATEYNFYAEHRNLPNVITVRYEDICRYPQILYESVGVTMPNNALKGIGYTYEHRTEPQPPELSAQVVHETPSDRFYNRSGRWKKELDPALAKRITELCPMVFEEGIYEI